MIYGRRTVDRNSVKKVDDHRLVMSYETVISIGSTELLIATLVFLVSYFIISAHYKKKKHLPPGPVGFPIVGHLPFLKKDPHLKLHDIASKYGDVFSIYLGSQLVVILNGADAVREGMNKQEFLGRPVQGAFTINPNIRSIFTVSGKHFQEQRKFILSCMRELGFGRTVFEECMKEEMEYFLSAINNWNGEPYDVKTVLAPSTSNNVTSFVYGSRYDYEDSRRKLFDNNRRIIADFLGQTAIHIFFPWINHMPFINKLFGHDRAIKAFDILNAFYREQIQEHRNTLDGSNPRDYVDKFLLEMQKIKEKKIPDASFTENMLIGNSGALMGAGSETVETTTDWCFYITAAYQDVQKKVQQEIDTVVGSERIPSYADHKYMPFTQAVIMEVMRWKTITPLNVLRCTFEDTTFRGYYIPRDVIILANLWSAHYDPKYWEEPETFKPERFLSPDGKCVIKPDAYMPFSTGRRSCPGEAMAVVEVFIYFTSVLQKFDIRLEEGHIPDFDGILTASYTAKPHKLCFIPRTSP